MNRRIFGYALLLHLVVVAGLLLWRGEDGADSPAVPVESGSDDSPVLESPVIPFEEVASPTAPEMAAAKNAWLQGEPVHASLPDEVRPQVPRSGVLVDLSEAKILWGKAMAEPVPIASMTKMMTSLLVFEAIEQRPDLTFQTVVPVSVAAYRIGGSQVWLDPRESFTLEELLISVLVKSANDSAYLLAEYLESGDVDRFVARMNERAVELGMTDTEFHNPHGLPEKGKSNVASCLDLVLLAQELLTQEKATEWSSIRTYKFRPDAAEPTVLMNHNRLVSLVKGVDGLKTGFTSRAGFCVTATCLRDGRRLVAVATGFSISKERDAFVRSLLEWGYQ